MRVLDRGCGALRQREVSHYVPGLRLHIEDRHELVYAPNLPDVSFFALSAKP